MAKIVILFLIISYCYNATAQSWEQVKVESVKSPPDIFFLPAHTFLREVAWRDSVYLFPSFQYGRITFATGYSPAEKVLLNYNLYLAEMAVTKDGDTTYLRRTKELKLISIGDHLFLHDHKIGYVEIIHRLLVSLGVLNVMNTEHMDYVSGNIAGTSFGTDMRGSPSVYDRYYKKIKRYYFIGSDNKVYKATRASIMKLFRGNKDEIDVYLRENGIDFEDKNDLVKLLHFCHDEVRKNQN